MSAAPIREDLLEGADAIAAYMGWKPRRVTYMREQASTCPIRKREGLGLYALRSELDAWLRDPSTLAPEARREN